MKWTSTFKYLPIEYNTTLAVVSDRTERVSLDNNLNGDQVRILLSNRYSEEELHISRMTIGVEENGIVKNPVTIKCGGSAEFILQPNETTFSDVAGLRVRAGERLAVSVYIGAAQEVQSVCGYWAPDGAYVSFNEKGDVSNGEAFQEVSCTQLYDFVRNDPSDVKGQFFYGFSAVQVLTKDEARVVAAFGDSITHMSFVTNALQKRLYAAYPGQVTLINTGIGGDRLVHDATWIPEAPGEGRLFGRSGVSRFEEDVFGTDRVDSVLVLMGVNDIMHPIQFEYAHESTAPEYLEKGFSYLIEKAHLHGARIFGATVTPSGNKDYPKWWIEAFEKTRLPLNEWIRHKAPYDGYFDYDAVLRDEAHPGYLKSGVHIGDGLHPNMKGGEMIAASIDLGLLTGFEEE